MLYEVITVLLALPGLPLLYAGDESALLNDSSWERDPVKRLDSRWIHRIALSPSRKETFPAAAEGDGSWLETRQRRVFSGLKSLLALRRGESSFGTGDISFRITSYNVCYTKLLRQPQGHPFRGYLFRERPFGGVSGEGAVGLHVPGGRAGVITSYSIHYTKLYEERTASPS